MTKQSEELKNCPFCGGEPISAQDGYIHCSECSCMVGTWIEWNTRTAPVEKNGMDINSVSKVIKDTCQTELNETIGFMLSDIECDIFAESICQTFKPVVDVPKNKEKE